MSTRRSEPPMRLFPRQRFTAKVEKGWRIRTPLDKWSKRGEDRIPVKGTINGEKFNAKLEFRVDPDWWWDVDIDPEGYYEIFLNGSARYQLRRLPLRVGMTVEVDFTYDRDQYAKDDEFRAKARARAARKRAERSKAESTKKPKRSRKPNR